MVGEVVVQMKAQPETQRRIRAATTAAWDSLKSVHCFGDRLKALPQRRRAGAFQRGSDCFRLSRSGSNCFRLSRSDSNGCKLSLPPQKRNAESERRPRPRGIRCKAYTVSAIGSRRYHNAAEPVRSRAAAIASGSAGAAATGCKLSLPSSIWCRWGCR